MTDFATLSLSALVRSYNTVAVALGETEVRKFSDKPGAVKRLHNIIVRALEADLVVVYDADGSVASVGAPFLEETTDKGATTEAETAPAPAAKLATTLDLTAKVKILVANPKRSGSRAHAVFALYAEGQTGQEFVDAVVAAGHTVRVALTNLHWDLDHGFIYLGE